MICKNIIIQEQMFNELIHKVRNRHNIRIFVGLPKRQGIDSISLMNAEIFTKLLKNKEGLKKENDKTNACKS